MSNSRNFLLSILLALAATATNANSPSAAALQECVDYGPATVSLIGTISRRTFINASEQKEIVWVLNLAKPICVNAGENSDFNVERAGVSEVQLVLEPEMFGKYRALVGKKVRATGTLFNEPTVHHFTPVLLDVSRMKLNR